MLMKTQYDSNREATGRLVSAETLTTVAVEQSAANASRWIESTSHARRLRRQRRMERTAHRSISGWSVRTW